MAFLDTEQYHLFLCMTVKSWRLCQLKAESFRVFPLPPFCVHSSFLRIIFLISSIRKTLPLCTLLDHALHSFLFPVLNFKIFSSVLPYGFLLVGATVGRKASSPKAILCLWAPQLRTAGMQVLQAPEGVSMALEGHGNVIVFSGMHERHPTPTAIHHTVRGTYSQ